MNFAPAIRISKQITHLDLIDTPSIQLKQLQAIDNYITELYKKLEFIPNSVQTKTLNINQVSKFLNLTYLVGERFCKAISQSEFYSKIEIVSALKIIYLGNIEERISFVFRMFDFNGDGFIRPGDVKILLSHLPIAISQENEGGFNFFVESYVEIMSLINVSFQSHSKLDLNAFKQVTLTASSDIFFAVYG